MKKLLKHYGNIFSTYGILTPIVIVSLAYVILIAMERNNAFSELLQNSLGWFIALGVIGVLSIAGIVVLLCFRIKVEEANALDLFLLIISVLTLLMLVLFCFNPGVLGFVSILKWVVVGLAFVGSIVATVFRSKYTN